MLFSDLSQDRTVSVPGKSSVFHTHGQIRGRGTHDVDKFRGGHNVRLHLVAHHGTLLKGVGIPNEVCLAPGLAQETKTEAAERISIVARLRTPVWSFKATYGTLGPTSTRVPR